MNSSGKYPHFAVIVKIPNLLLAGELTKLIIVMIIIATLPAA